MLVNLLFILLLSVNLLASGEDQIVTKTSQALYQYLNMEKYFQSINERIIPKELQKYGGVVWIGRCVAEQKISFERGF